VSPPEENPRKLLFSTPRKEGSAYSRNDVVRSGLKPILRKLGVGVDGQSLNAFAAQLGQQLDRLPSELQQDSYQP
jgi:hypothetical protein